MALPFVPKAAALAAAGLLASCCGHPREQGAAVAAGWSGPPWSVRIGSQGGFTGGGSGHLLRSDGTVLAWSRVTPQDSVETHTAGMTSGESLRALHAALESLAASKTEFASSGNMTVFLEWMEAPAPRRWSWPAGTSDAKIPAPVHHAYLAALAAVADARPAASK